MSPGRAVGPVVLAPAPVAEPAPGAPLPGPDREAEAARIAPAAAEVRAELERRAAGAGGDARELLEATALMAADPTLVDAAAAKVRADGLSAERAVWVAAGEVAEALAALGDYLAGRAADVRDVRDRLVAALTGRPAPGVPVRAEPFVLVARDLAPADTATLDPAACLALVTAEGGPTSHTAILARSLGLPAVVGAPGALELAEGTVVLVDGGAGTVEPDPPAGTVGTTGGAGGGTVRPTVPRFGGAGRTSDGHRVALLANVGGPRDVAAAVEAGAEGVGLFRTEFCFLDRREVPPVAEQVAAYRAVLAAFPGRRVVVRTLDAGADKPLPFLAGPAEPNPALGVRGVRTARRSPAVLADQLTAIAEAAAAEAADVAVMAPMVATADEAAAFAALCAERGLTPGVMVETPAAAVCAAEVLAPVAFASLGTNDLTQYAVAADRQLGELAGLNDPWQPAALRLAGMTCRAGRELGRPVGVCGEAAADPALACVLVGLGATSLSMTPRAIDLVAAVLASVSRAECERLAALATAAAGPERARSAVRGALPALERLGG